MPGYTLTTASVDETLEVGESLAAFLQAGDVVELVRAIGGG